MKKEQFLPVGKPKSVNGFLTADAYIDSTITLQQAKQTVKKLRRTVFDLERTIKDLKRNDRIMREALNQAQVRAKADHATIKELRASHGVVSE